MKLCIETILQWVLVVGLITSLAGVIVTGYSVIAAQNVVFGLIGLAAIFLGIFPTLFIVPFLRVETVTA